MLSAGISRRVPPADRLSLQWKTDHDSDELPRVRNTAPIPRKRSRNSQSLSRLQIGPEDPQADGRGASCKAGAGSVTSRRAFDPAGRNWNYLNITGELGCERRLR